MSKEYFTSRRSCRNFQSIEISDNLLNDIILKASKAPTCGNMQLYTVVVTKDKNRLKQLSALHYNQPAAFTAPCILTICADFNRFTHWCEINNADAGYDNFHSFIVALTDAVIFAQQIVTVTELAGLGSCYLGTVTYNAHEISQMLECPELVVPIASVALGVPQEAGEKTSRLPIGGIMHKERYKKDYDKEIIEIFKVHDEDTSNKKFIEENNKQNLAQVFAEVRYPRQLNEEVSKTFLNLLKKKGFLK